MEGRGDTDGNGEWVRLQFKDSCRTEGPKRKSDCESGPLRIFDPRQYNGIRLVRPLSVKSREKTFHLYD